MHAGISPRPSPSCGGRGTDQGLRVWSRSPEGVGFPPAVMAASAVVRGVTGTEALGLHFCAGFPHPGPRSGRALVRSRIGAGGAGTTLLSWFHSLPSIFTNAHTGNGCFHPGSRQGGLQASFLFLDCTHSPWQPPP